MIYVAFSHCRLETFGVRPFLVYVAQAGATGLSGAGAVLIAAHIYSGVGPLAACTCRGWSITHVVSCPALGLACVSHPPLVPIIAFLGSAHLHIYQILCHETNAPEPPPKTGKVSQHLCRHIPCVRQGMLPHSAAMLGLQASHKSRL